ncbi:hypothetical protein ACFPOE_20815 [Caenimonas terrae]|uniref:Cold-shock protein n=1 Tax=Caenimonas terrae TaxID=696074 RepID=A0ABW0NLI8_9BURK
MRNIIVVLLLAAVAWFGWGKYQDRVHAQREAELASQPAKKKVAPLPAARPGDPAVSFFTCDGRTSCKQMTSCEEARYFIKTCPGFNSGVSGEEASCENQWCRK